MFILYIFSILFRFAGQTPGRDVFEETGLKLGELELFGIYSEPKFDKTFTNGDQVCFNSINFTCNQY